MYPGEHAKSRWDEPAFIMATSCETVTFRQYDERANQLAHLYRAQGLRRMDHVAFFFENNLRMLECEGGAERSGLYYTCINSYLAPDEVAYIINDSQSKIVVTSAAKREVAMQLPALCPNVERWLMAFAGVLAIFVCYVHGLVVEANAASPQRLAEGPFIGGLVAFVAFALAWSAAFYYRFRRPR